MPYEPTPEMERRAREAFEAVLARAMPAYELGQLKLFHDEEETFIQREVERKLYEAQLPNGGQKERHIIEKLKRLALDREWAGRMRASAAIKLWEKVLPGDPRNRGRYYVRHVVTPRQDKAQWEWLNTLKESAHESKQWDRKWFAQLLLDGAPDSVSNFYLECLFLLKRCDGNVDRLVRLHNVMGERTGIETMDAEAFHAPQKFRKWCLQKGNYNWAGNEKDTEKLHEDVAHDAAWRVVNQVVTFGWLPLEERVKPGRLDLEGIWFFRDCAYGNDQYLRADEDGIYWHNEEGYQMADDGRENAFLQKKPAMHPDLSVREALEEWRREKGECRTESRTQNEECGMGDRARQSAATGDATGSQISDLKGETDLLLLRDFFREFSQRLVNTVGGPEAYFVIGSVLAFASAPEIFALYSLFPGLWIHGQANSGKSTICEWLMEMFGFVLHNGLILRGRTVSAVGLLQAADQYSNLPVWGDEFRNLEVDEDKLGVLHNGYNRGGQAKFNPSRIQRLMRTTFLVSGESTSNDAATRGRYPHVQVSQTRRMGTEEEQKENFAWFNQHRHNFFLFGRFLMENRNEFTRLVIESLKVWGNEEIDARLKIVHGVGYSAFRGMVALLQSHTSDELRSFKTYMLEHSKSAAADVVSELNVNVFWSDLLTAWKAEAVPASCFKLEGEYMANPPDAPGQGRWTSYRLFIDPDPTISALQIFLTKQRMQVSLKRKDLRDQLSKNPYWVPGDKVKKRFGRSSAVVHSWGIILDRHPMGYQRVEQDEYNHFLMHEEEGDPRKGPLYKLVDDLEALAKQVGRE